MVSLYLAADERAKAAKLLKEAVSTSQKLTKSEDMKIVWRKTAEFHLKGDEPSVAAKSLEELLKANPNDKTTLAQLVLAYAKFDLKKAMEISKKLPDFATRDVDVDGLEATATMSRYVVVKFEFRHFYIGKEFDDFSYNNFFLSDLVKREVDLPIQYLPKNLKLQNNNRKQKNWPKRNEKRSERKGICLIILLAVCLPLINNVFFKLL